MAGEGPTPATAQDATAGSNAAVKLAALEGALDDATNAADSDADVPAPPEAPCTAFELKCARRNVTLLAPVDWTAPPLTPPNDM